MRGLSRGQGQCRDPACLLSSCEAERVPVGQRLSMDEVALDSDRGAGGLSLPPRPPVASPALVALI